MADPVLAAEDAALDVLATTAMCGSTSVFLRLWADLPIVAPRLAPFAAAIRPDDSRAALAQLATTARVSGARHIAAQMRGPVDLVAPDGCGIATLGPLLWRLLHTVAQMPQTVVVSGRTLSPIAYLLLVFVDYFPPACPCRANYSRMLPQLRRAIRRRPVLSPADGLLLTVALHAAVNRTLKRPPYGLLGSEAAAMEFWMRGGQ